MNLFTGTTRGQRPLFLILLAGLAVRVATVALFDPPRVSDDLDYHALAESLIQEKGFSINGIPTSYRTPGYPAMVALCYTFFGESPYSVRVVQVVLDLCSVLLLYSVGKRLFSHSVGLWAAAILALFPLQFLYVSHVMSEIPFAALLLLALWMAITGAGAPSAGRLAALGLVLGVATLVRPVVMLLPFVFLPYWRIPREPPIRSVVRIAVVLAGISLVVVPWMMRNHHQFGRFSITSNTGVNLWIGHHAGAGGSFHYPTTPDNPLHRVADDYERSDLGVKLALQFIREHPWEEILLTAKKTAHFFSADYWLMMTLEYDPRWKSYPNAATIYSDISTATRSLTQIPFMIVTLLFFAGLIFRPEESSRHMRLLGSIFLYWFVAHVVFFAATRYRFPVNSVMVLGAAYALTMIRFRSYRFTKRRSVIFGIVLLVLVAGWMSEYVTLRMKRLPVPAASAEPR